MDFKKRSFFELFVKDGKKTEFVFLIFPVVTLMNANYFYLSWFSHSIFGYFAFKCEGFMPIFYRLIPDKF